MSVQTSVQVEPPVGAYWIRTEVTPAVELATAVSVAVRLSRTPGSLSETEETVLSTTRLATAADVVALPASSVAIARKE